MTGSLEPRPLAALGRTVSPLGLGTAALAVRYGAPGGERDAPDARTARAAIERALAAGLTLVDTAPAYGEAEELVGEVVGAVPECVVATKLAIPAAGWGALDPRSTRDHVRASIQASRRRLRRDRLDVLQVHNATAGLLAGDSALMAALGEARRDGEIGAVGATTYAEADALAAVAHPTVDVVNVAMSALDRRPSREVLRRAAPREVAVTTRSVLLRGVLGPLGAAVGGSLAPLRAAADAFRTAIGAEWASLPGAAVAWALCVPGPASVLLGPRDATELSELLAGAERFRDAAAQLDDGWQVELPDALLDASRWPVEGAP